jgi:hypothetical protein
MKSCLWCDWIPISLAWDHFTDPTPKRKIIGAHATNKANHFINNKKLEVNDIVDGQQRGPTYLDDGSQCRHGCAAELEICARSHIVVEAGSASPVAAQRRR